MQSPQKNVQSLDRLQVGDDADADRLAVRHGRWPFGCAVRQGDAVADDLDAIAGDQGAAPEIFLQPLGIDDDAVGVPAGDGKQRAENEAVPGLFGAKPHIALAHQEHPRITVAEKTAEAGR